MNIFLILINCYFTTIGICIAKNKINRKLAHILSLIITTAEVAFTFGLIQAIVTADVNIYRIRLVVAFICDIHYIIIRHGCQMKNTLLEKLAKELADQTAMDLLNQRNGKTKRILSFLLGSYLTGIIFLSCFSIPFIIIIKKLNPELDYNDPAYYILPYLFKYWHVESLFGYILVNMFQYSSIVPIATSYVFCVLFLFSTITNLLFRYGTISEKVTNIIQSDMEAHEFLKLHKHTDDLFDDFVQYHQYLNRFESDIQLLMV